MGWVIVKDKDLIVIGISSTRNSSSIRTEITLGIITRGFTGFRNPRALPRPCASMTGDCHPTLEQRMPAILPNHCTRPVNPCIGLINTSLNLKISVLHQCVMIGLDERIPTGLDDVNVHPDCAKGASLESMFKIHANLGCCFFR